MDNKSKSLKETFIEAYKKYQIKDFKNAESICYKILNIDPNHINSFSLLATIAAFRKDFNSAKELLLKVIKIDPKNVSAYNNLGASYKELRKYDEAINSYNKILKINPKHVNAHYNLGLIYYNLKNLEKAKNYFQKTAEMQSNYGLAFFSLGNVYVDLKEYEKAISSYQKAIEINPNIIGAHNNLGLTFRILNDLENAIKCYEEAISRKPDHAGTHHNLGLALKEIGKFDKAIISHQEAIKYEPNNTAHYFYLSELKKDILDKKLRNKIEEILKNKNTKKIGHAYGNYILAKFERNSKNYEKELNFLKEGHKNFFESNIKKFKLGIKYCFEDVLQVSEGAKIDGSEKKYKVKPIFIIGVPRCGSTLIEKIIASGKKNIPMGEEVAVLENFFNKKVIEKQSLNLGNVEIIRNELYEIYKGKGLLSEKYQYNFTDKSLNNFFYLELIKLIYPEAKIINCKRDILSSIMSIFQNNLTELAWTHDLQNIFKYFDNYINIVENFDEAYPNYIYHLSYEKLVENPEEESKKVMKYCNLDWDKKCLEFYKRKDLISKTTSNIQIRRAIYKDSINKYDAYKKLLKEYGSKYSWFNLK